MTEIQHTVELNAPTQLVFNSIVSSPFVMSEVRAEFSIGRDDAWLEQYLRTRVQQSLAARSNLATQLAEYALTECDWAQLSEQVHLTLSRAQWRRGQ